MKPLAVADTNVETTDAAIAIVGWIEGNFGGEIRSIEQQPRWRPTWFAEVAQGEETARLCIRGERSDTLLWFPLQDEMHFQQVLHDHGIPVPRVHGWCDRPEAIVMDLVAGRPDFTGVTDAQRDRIVDEYIQALARLHSLPIEPFVAAGVERAAAPQASGQLGFSKMVSGYRTQKRHPDPFLEFALGWMDRHPPRSLGREAPIVWDSGQFHHDGEHLVALLDLETGHIGDPMMDLAGLRMRDSVIPFGDFNAFYRRYEDIVGQPVDLEAIELHHIAFTLSNELSFGHTLRDMISGSDFATNMQWCNETNIYATEAIADYMGLDLPTVEVPPVRPSRTAVASAHLAHSLRSLDIHEPMLRYRTRSAFRVAQHLARADEIGAEILADDLEDVHQLLDRRPVDWHEGERQLEEYVLIDRDTGLHDELLVPFFHRRHLRAQMMNGPEGSAMARHNPIQRFPKRASR